MPLRDHAEACDAGIRLKDLDDKFTTLCLLVKSIAAEVE